MSIQWKTINNMLILTISKIEFKFNYFLLCFSVIFSPKILFVSEVWVIFFENENITKVICFYIKIVVSSLKNSNREYAEIFSNSSLARPWGGEKTRVWRKTQKVQ